MTEASTPEVQAPVIAKPKQGRKPAGPVCEKGFQVVNHAGVQIITDDDLFVCLDALKKMATGAKLNRQDGVLIAFNTKPKIHPEERREPIVFKKR